MGLFKFLKEKFSHKKDGESSLNETKIQNNEESLDKIKNKELTDENNKELAKYDKGLEKSRKEFAE